SVLVRLLLSAGYRVRVVDNLMFGGESIVDLLTDEQFEFILGDIRDKRTAEESLEDIDIVVHLAAIVGDPACREQPELARSTNLEASKQLHRFARKLGARQFIFASTCSNYGKMDDPEAFVTETTRLAPISLYAETKVEFEQYLLSHDEATGEEEVVPTILRFSTVYGLSPRPRFDLTVNEFTKELALGRELVIFGRQFWRPYCHVVDLARSVIEVIESPRENIEYEVFNVGSNDENYTKQMLVDAIVEQIPDAQLKYVKKDEDPRDYRVNFDKISEQLGFSITKRVPDGITEVRKAVTEGFFNDPDDPRYRNS
ncbi:MAG: SDR family oxidoreductase, partial [Balneolaceae bacterium]|nr:SDR family oxidoreductase [Balneolaceae bacterium]